VKNFALIGAAGFVAPRHLRAIRDTGNRLLAAADPHDSVGVLDGFFPAARYFPEIERLDRHLEKLRRGPESGRAHWVAICSPNYLHDAHARLALRVGADVICEKPLVISPWNLDQLAALEAESGRRVFTVLQLRLHPAVAALRARLGNPPSTLASLRVPSPSPGGGREGGPQGGCPGGDLIQGPGQGFVHDVELTWVTGRGSWYLQSWKGGEERSGGIAMNIGVHLFDLLLWLFGPVRDAAVRERAPTRLAGALELERARVRFLLSVDFADLPPGGGASAHRLLKVDGEEIDLSGGFEDLHTRVYAETLAGRGCGIEDARPSIELVHRLRQTEVTG
jgi:UDP-N-acetyl-2-amino-2-deoxyglucuronate dehydrogenase